MICLTLFLTFLKIGAVSFGGGYAMISLIRDEVLAHGWMNEADLLNLIAVSESTPGPIAVNAATFIGSRQAGIAGAAAATLGVVLPSFLIILLISVLFRSLLKYKAVQGILSGIRPCVIGLILATALSMFLTSLLGFSSVGEVPAPSVFGILIFAFAAAADILIRHFRKKPTSPLILIALSAVLGAILFSV